MARTECLHLHLISYQLKTKVQPRFSCVPFLEMCTSWLLQFNISNEMEMSEGVCFIAVL